MDQLEVRVHEEINAYKERFYGLTLRQWIFVIITLLVDIPGYIYLKKYIMMIVISNLLHLQNILINILIFKLLHLVVQVGVLMDIAKYG